MRTPELSPSETEDRLAQLVRDASAELMQIVDATAQLLQTIEEFGIRLGRLETAMGDRVARSKSAATLH